ncbi:peptidase dimerization domain-containing protein [Pseudomonas ogarae]|uniref:peptidase dimerization domain-containing protein n=1 Tax=Pseudomonas ogarae (strain DSM 112162 / CECT 30235 / F113) TaxID=1114970 RepID=UPI001F438050|nr:peptidase dimerization domain-containing protein [Pseudomonas ogarae]
MPALSGVSPPAAFPWTDIDPVPVAAHVIMAWQTIPSRHSNLSLLPAPVISVGQIEAGDRHNIISAEVRLAGSIRTVSDEQREDVLQRMTRTAEKIAEAAEASGASAKVDYLLGNYRAGYNNTALVDQLMPVLQQVSTTPVRTDNGTRSSTWNTGEWVGYTILPSSAGGVTPMRMKIPGILQAYSAKSLAP